MIALITQLLAGRVLPDISNNAYSPLVYWIAGFGTALLFLASLLAHELMHAIVARHYGVPVRQITLWMLGGMAELTKEPPNPKADGAIAGVGPLTSWVLATIFTSLAVTAQLLTTPLIVVTALMWLGVMNFVLAVFNLLPGAPLDGGRLLRAIVWWRSGNWIRAVKTAAKAGAVLGWILAGLGGFEILVLSSLSGIWLILIGWFIVLASTVEEQAEEQPHHNQTDALVPTKEGH